MQKKSRAKQKASMAYIQAYVNNTLITAPDIFADENEDNYPEKNADQDDDINPKKKILLIVSIITRKNQQN